MGRGSRDGRWIIVADSPFLPARDGGAREHAGFLAAAVVAGRVAALVVPSDEPDPATLRARLDAAADGAPVLITPRDRRLRRALDPRTPYVVASRPAPRGLPAAIGAAAPDAAGVVLFSPKAHRLAAGLRLPVVLRAHNREGVYHHALARAERWPRRAALHAEAIRVAREEHRLERAPWLTGIADISAVDAAWRAAHGTVPVRHVPPFAAPTGPAVTRTPVAGRVLFVGTLSVATNRDAVAHLIDEVWPAVRAAVPTAELEIVGRSPSPALVRTIAATPGATLHADVDDLDDHLRTAAVAVAPTVGGSGVNIKLVDYLHAGVPVVATTAAAAPLGARAGDDVLVADGPRPFAAAVRALLADPARAAALGAAGRAFLARTADPARGISGLADLFAVAEM